MALWATRPFRDELPELLRERQLSQRAVARLAGVGDDHLSRVVRGARGKRPSEDLVRRVALALELPEDYFLEARLAFVCERLGLHHTLLDSVYSELVSLEARRRTPSRQRRRPG